MSPSRSALIALGVLLSGCGALRPITAIKEAARPGSPDDPEVKTPTAHFLDQTTLAVSPKRPARLIHETQAAANIVVAQTLARAGSEVRADKAGENGLSRWRLAHMITVTPNFIIRQLDDSSAAVRTPSFNPKGTYQLFWMRKSARPGDSTNVATWKHVDVGLMDFVFAHYSNGQAGCFYESQRFVREGRDFECRWIGGDSTDRSVNLSDGSFSTWYTRLSLGAERHWGIGIVGAESSKHIGALVGLQYHLPFMTAASQREPYGDWRFVAHGEAERRWGPANVRLGVQFDRSLDGADKLPKSHWSAEVSTTFERLFGLGLFVRRHEGQDYQNIAFVNRLNTWHYGIAFRIDKRDVFPR